MFHSRLFPVTLSVTAICGALAGCKSPATAPQGQGAVVEEFSGTSSGASSSAHPATPQDVYRSTTADLNGDGFVTLDEVVAMKQAGLTDDQMLARLRATNQIYELTQAQENYLRAHGISNDMIAQMEVINRDQRQQVLSSPEGGLSNPPGAVISAPPPEMPVRPGVPPL